MVGRELHTIRPVGEDHLLVAGVKIEKSGSASKGSGRRSSCDFKS